MSTIDRQGNRLNQYIASCGICSRREADRMIEAGRVYVNGVPAKATHVGIYIGDGRFIHSSWVVRVSSLDPSAPDYYDRKPLCARRVVGQVDIAGSGVISVFSSQAYFPR